MFTQSQLKTIASGIAPEGYKTYVAHGGKHMHVIDVANNLQEFGFDTAEDRWYKKIYAPMEEKTN